MIRTSKLTGCTNCVLTVVADGALVITVVVHEDLSHLAVVQVVQVSHGVLRAGNQVQEDVGGLHTSDKLMLKKKMQNVFTALKEN